MVCHSAAGPADWMLKLAMEDDGPATAVAIEAIAISEE
jgi:hypothetical protein